MLMRKVNLMGLLYPPNFFVLFFFLYLFIIPTIDILLDISNSGLRFITFDYLLGSYFVVIVYLFFFVLFAYFIVPNVLVLRNSYESVGVFYARLFVVRRVLYSYVIVLYALATCIYLYYFYSIDAVPALRDDVSTYRSTAKSGYGGIILFANSMTLIGAIILGALKNISQSRLYPISLIMFIFVGFLSAGTGFRGPVGLQVLALALSVSFNSPYYFKHHKIQKKYIFFGVFLLIAVSLAGVVRNGGAFDLNSFLSILWIGTVNFYNLDMIYRGFSDEYFYHGYTFLNDILVAMPGFSGSFTGVLLKDILALEFKGQGMTVTAPGEGYINFGWYGVVLHAALLGSVLSVLGLKLMGSSSVTGRILCIFLTLLLAKFVTSGIMPTLIFSIIPGFIILILLNVFLNPWFEKLNSVGISRL